MNDEATPSAHPSLLHAVFGQWDLAVAGEVQSGRLEKAPALVMFTAFRDAVRLHDPELADCLIPERTEQA